MENLINSQQCPVCNSRTKILTKKVSNPSDQGSLDNKLIREILKLDTVEHQLRFCPRCFHIFRLPLYNELAVVEKQLNASQEIMKKTPGHTLRPTLGCLMDDARMRLYKYTMIADFLKALPFEKEKVKILDWGGGTGLVSNIFSLLFNKSSDIPAKAYSYDINSRFGKYPFCPYIEYIGHDKIKDDGPYDIIVISHVLEHVAFPVELAREALSYLADNGVLLVVLPYEQDGILSPNSVYLSPHMHLYSQRSTLELLRVLGFKNAEVGEIDVFNKYWSIEDGMPKNLLGKTYKVKNIIAYAVNGEINKKCGVNRAKLIYLQSAYSLVFRILIRVWRKICGIPR